MAKASALNMDLSSCTGLDLSGSQVTGNLSVAFFDGGINASSTTYFRGDGTWQTPSSPGTFPAGDGKSSLLYYSSSGSASDLSQYLGGNRSVLCSDASGNPTWVDILTTGMMLMGSSSGPPAGALITTTTPVTFSANTLGLAIDFSTITGTSGTLTAFCTFVANNASLVTLTLPLVARVGTIIRVLGFGAGGWAIAQNSGQSIAIGSSTSSVGTGGSVSSSNRYDSVRLICVSANTKWVALGKPMSSGLTIV